MEPWILDPAVAHLNHGSFGATPLPVLAAQERYRLEMENNPILFFMKNLQPALDASREVLADFLGASTEGLVFVPNATSGINTVLQSLAPALGPGDEILITDHTYNACRNAAEVVAIRSGATLVEAPVPFPTMSPAEFASALLSRVTSSTRLVLVDMVTSPTALVVPVADLVAELEPEIPVLVDAAHAPGMLPLDLEHLGASYVVGNCHKWMCAPKSAGFLYARDDRRDGLVPTTISHAWNLDPAGEASRFHSLFDWTGTDDPTARLSIPEAIETIGGLRADGWDGVRSSNHRLVCEGRQMIADTLGLDTIVPEAMLGSMATFVVPDGADSVAAGDMDPLTRRLRDEWNIEVPVFSWRDWPGRLVRISAQLYNQKSEYVRLARALRKEIV